MSEKNFGLQILMINPVGKKKQIDGIQTNFQKRFSDVSNFSKNVFRIFPKICPKIHNPYTNSLSKSFREKMWGKMSEKISKKMSVKISEKNVRKNVGKITQTR